MSEPMILVWDRFVRLFHWALLALIATTFFTHGGLLQLHRLAGYGIGLLLAARVAWGFVGSRHARFADFVPGPARLIAYLALAARGREPRTIGHNPAGAAMVLLLLVLIGALVGTGIALDTNAFRDYRPLHGLHDDLADALLIAGAIHVAGVLYTGMRHRENLVRAMLTGRKRAP